MQQPKLSDIAARLGLDTRHTLRLHERTACCPFHAEQTPSFYVNDLSSTFRCYGCGAHGDGADLVRRLLLAGISPARRHFHDSLPADGLLDARDCRVLWNDADSGRVGACDVTVVFLPVRLALPVHPLWDEWKLYDRLWHHAAGNTDREWMAGRPEGTPDALFAYFRDEERFADQAEHDRAVRQFAKIRECGWARDMVAGLPGSEQE